MFLQIEEPSAPQKKTISVGIDLGTTHTVIAYTKDDHVFYCQTGDGFLLPSIVGFDNQTYFVGHDARSLDQQIHSVKRFMHEPAHVVAFNQNAVELSSKILKKAKDIAELELGEDVYDAVITVPAYFDETARQATKDAAALAGFNVLRLINEPTAAALAYGLDHHAEGLYMIYDLGGGTFDVSVLQFRKGVFQVIATGGHTQLGGDDIDTLIMKKLNMDDSLSNRLKARDLKHSIHDQSNAISELTAGDLLTLSCSLIQTTLKICDQVLKDASIHAKDLMGIVLVGGSTRLFGLKDALFAHYGMHPLSNIDPDLCVANGAARQAHALTQGSETLLLDVTPLSLGIETMGGMVEKIIYKNAPIPIQKAQDFTTYQDNQTGLKIHVLQGEREMVEDCRSLCSFTLSGIPPMPAGMARVRVTFALDVDGLLTVRAKELHTNIEQTVDVKPTYGLDPAQVKKMIYDAHLNARQDMQTRLCQESVIQGEHFLRVVEKALADDGDLLDAMLFDQIQKGLFDLKNAIDQKDREEIERIKRILATTTQDFAEKRLTRSILKSFQES
ncbi:MAG: Chaperone protein HscA [Holosporales bacterium]